MPFIDKSTLTYPATNSFPVRKWLDPLRNPVSGINGDFRQFQIFDVWINENNQTAWIMVDRTVNSGTWIQMGSSGGTGILTITGNSGGAVPADGSNNINVVGGTNVTVTGVAGTNTLTITLSGALASSFPTNSGTAIPSAGVLNILGTGGLTTSGAGNTVTVTAGPTIPTTFNEDSGSATPALNILKIVGGTGVTTSGAGNTVTINASASVPITFTADVGTATPAANNLNVFGSGGTTTSAAGSTITITSAGFPWTELTVVGPTAGVNNHGYVMNNASPVQLTLPLTSALGATIIVVGKGSGGWQINQNAGQQIVLGPSGTTVGATGTVTSSEPTACIEIVCITANLLYRIRDVNGNVILT